MREGFLLERAGKLPTNTLITELVGKNTPMGSCRAGAGRQLRAGRAVLRLFRAPCEERRPRPGLGRSRESLGGPVPAGTVQHKQLGIPLLHLAPALLRCSSLHCRSGCRKREL